MGRPMATNLLKSGFPVVVFNRTRARCEDLAGLGANAADSPKELASQSDVVITIVSDTPDVESVLFGKDGVVYGLKEGMTIIVLRQLPEQLAQPGMEQ